MERPGCTEPSSFTCWGPWASQRGIWRAAAGCVTCWAKRSLLPTGSWLGTRGCDSGDTDGGGLSGRGSCGGAVGAERTYVGGHQWLFFRVPLKDRLHHIFLFHLQCLGHENPTLSLTICIELDPWRHGLGNHQPRVNIWELAGVPRGPSNHSAYSPDSWHVKCAF